MYFFFFYGMDGASNKSDVGRCQLLRLVVSLIRPRPDDTRLVAADVRGTANSTSVSKIFSDLSTSLHGSIHGLAGGLSRARTHEDSRPQGVAQASITQSGNASLGLTPESTGANMEGSWILDEGAPEDRE